MVPGLAGFLAAAERVADATPLSEMDLGAIWYDKGPVPILLAFRGALVPAGGGDPDEFEGGPLHARRFRVGRHDWPKIVRDLSRNVLQVTPWITLGTFEVGRQTPLPWHFSERTHPRGINQSAVGTSVSGGTFKELLGPEVLASLDGAIAKHSHYEIASFARLAKRFVGQSVDGRENADLELFAQWPISDISLERNGGRVRIVLHGVQKLDSARFIVNVESASVDRRLQASELEWIETPVEEQQSRYVAIVDDHDRRITAANVYFDGVDEVRHRSELRDQTFWEGSVGATPPRDVSFEASPGILQSIHVEGFRSLRDVRIALEDVRVLIGPNQAGKSSILESLEMLRAASRASFYDALVRKRGGLGRVLWRGGGPGMMQFDADLLLGANAFRFSFVVGPVGAHDYQIETERLYERVGTSWRLLLGADKGVAKIDGTEHRTTDPHELMLLASPSGMHGETLRGIASTLAAIRVYPGFATGPAWVDTDHARIRRANRVEPNARLDPLGENLTAALHSLSQRQPDEWEEFVEILKLVFDRLERISFPPVETDRVQLAWKEEGVKTPFTASELSDGTLQLLASLCALYQGGSVVALDEPERHLHPEALYRLTGAAIKSAARAPVLLATQSDHLLGFFDETPSAILVVRRGAKGTEVIQPTPDELAEWAKRFSLADLRHELETWNQTV